MRELIRTSDPVLLGFVRAILRDCGIEAIVLDQHMSVLEGSIGALPRRVMVDAGAWFEARRVLTDAGLAHELGNDDSEGSDGRAG